MVLAGGIPLLFFLCVSTLADAAETLPGNVALADRTEIEFFNGGHTIHGQGSFDFLHRHLGWPKPEDRR
jgi:hypothetical protein